jgi:hypothetical protein
MMTTDRVVYIEIHMVCFSRDYAESRLEEWRKIFEKYEVLHGPLLLEAYGTLGETTWSWVDSDPYECWPDACGATHWSTNYRPTILAIANCNERYATDVANELYGAFGTVKELPDIDAYERTCDSLQAVYTIRKKAEVLEQSA